MYSNKVICPFLETVPAVTHLISLHLSVHMCYFVLPAFLT